MFFVLMTLQDLVKIFAKTRPQKVKKKATKFGSDFARPMADPKLKPWEAIGWKAWQVECFSK